jgi:hypothetical protein
LWHYVNVKLRTRLNKINGLRGAGSGLL